jgi:hypothetical protein
MIEAGRARQPGSAGGMRRGHAGRSGGNEATGRLLFVEKASGGHGTAGGMHLLRPIESGKTALLT